MKITKFRDVLDGEERLNHEQVIDNLVEISKSTRDTSDNVIENLREVKSNQLETKDEIRSGLESVCEDVEKARQDITQAVSGVQPRTEKTKIYNQKIEEDIIILESSDINFEIPDDTCDDIFKPTQKLPEINQFFILEESTPEIRCQQRKFNFDTDQEHALRLDQYSGDHLGYFHAYGHSENNSSDLSIINDTLFKIKLRTDEKKDFITIDDGFTLSLNDVEREDEVSLKRDHTISGYTITYMVEGKANA
tara:strand:+ start:2847 stop:3596 length:750 start_codon:yes stop_codon:yes gene_type:complete